MHHEPNDNWHDRDGTPGGVLWPVKRTLWFLEKHLLWPVADSFRRMADAFRYRSPLAYVGATLMVTVTAGAIAAAVYFYNQSEAGSGEPLLADAVPETVLPPGPTPTPVPATTDTTPDSSGDPEKTLQGVVPDFTATGKRNRQGGGGSEPELPATVVRPAAVPDAPPLKVAHRFATTFASYEVGRRGAAKRFARTATAELARDLRENPPKLPSTGQIPKATVVNIVPGKNTGDSMAVSVSLMRTGAASELRLTLDRRPGRGWLVSQVRG